MADATAVRIVKRGNEQFGGLWGPIWAVTATIDADNLADAAGDTDTVAVNGVALGDQVLSISFGVDTAGITVTAWVSAANVVSIRFQNESGGAVNLGSTTVKLVVGRPVW
jgi:hypothetical protein